MIVAPVRARVAFADGRLDAKYHCSPGVLASERMKMLQLTGARLRPIAGDGGLGVIGASSRTKRVYAAPGEDSLPYLRPYDVFDYLPQPADYLSTSGSSELERLTPTPGTILQTCSGRNLGPLALADEYLARFVVSDDMLRLNIDDLTERMYALAFLSTPTGQALLTRSKTGNVIDHLSGDDFARVEVPFINDSTTDRVVDLMTRAVSTREHARVRLAQLVAEYQATLPPIVQSSPRREGWTQKASALGNRLDVAPHDPIVEDIRLSLSALGGTKLEDVAAPSMPNRYKRMYVQPEFGHPILSGRQLLQLRPVNLQFIAGHVLDIDEFRLGEGTLVFGARGRAEERISLPALVTGERAEWLASHNVMRVRPMELANAGWLYLAFSTDHVQIQVKASAFGSVVDVVDPANLAAVVLPPVDEIRGAEALECWRDFDQANELETRAIEVLEASILSASAQAN